MIDFRHEMPGLPNTHRVERQSLASVLFRTLSAHGPRHLGHRRLSYSRDAADDRSGGTD